MDTLSPSDRGEADIVCRELASWYSDRFDLERRGALPGVCVLPTMACGPATGCELRSASMSDVVLRDGGLGGTPAGEDP